MDYKEIVEEGLKFEVHTSALPSPEELLEMADDLRGRAHEALEDFPLGAVSLIKSAAVLDLVRVTLVSCRRSPPLSSRKTKAGAIAKAQKAATHGLAKVKHVYGSSGSCLVDHDGNGPCGKFRERKPRAGAAVAAAAAEDDRTLAIPGTEASS